MAERQREYGDGDVDDVAAARAIERQMQELRQRVDRGGVMEYLKPLGPGGRKDVNKQFLTSTIMSVDSHNRRHEEDKLWKIRELERKLDDQNRSHRVRSRSRSYSPDVKRRQNGRYRGRSRSRSRSRERDRDRRRRDRSRSSRRETHRKSPRPDSRDTPTRKITTDSTSDAEREYWAAKKAEKTKKMWENVYAGTTSVMVANAPEFSSEEDSDDSDERVHDVSDDRDDSKDKKHKKSKKQKREKKAKKHKKDKKHKSSPAC